MRIIGTVILACMGFGAAAAQPAHFARPVIAPPESWVVDRPIPAAPPAAQGASTVDLLSDTQVRFTASGDTTYRAQAYKITSAQGLEDGALQLSWDPALETLTIHHYRLLRDGKTIDLLGDGSKLSVVQREKNMEDAALDGRLTAALQPDDLRIGDIVELASSVTQRDPAMDGRSEAVLGPRDGVPYGGLHIRVLWPATKTVHWRALPGVIQPKVIRSAAGTELTADLDNVTTQKPPHGAPARFTLVNAIQLTEFPDWASVSRLSAPLYESAAALGADSAVRGEAAKIAAATPDPVKRAEMALRLVQDQVRYLFLGMDDGGFVPAAADVTWTRRFGDCKAKTVLLVALLRALQIEARPVLVNTEQGDYVASQLPAMGAFDHAIVEAKIGGRSYWMDGTRLGDTRLDRLRTPDYQVGLPILPQGAGLEPLTPEALDQPDQTTSLSLDARGGVDIPAPATAEVRYHGETATNMRVKYSGMSQLELDTALRKLWHDTYDFVTPSVLSTREDDASGDFLLTMRGTAKMDWYKDAGSRWYELDGARLGWKFDDARDGQLIPDAPFAFDYPDWWANKETIQLPNNGKDFRLQVEPVDTTINGLYVLHRQAAIKDGTLTMGVNTRALAAELPAAKAADTRTKLAALQQQGVYVRMPTTYQLTDAELANLKADRPALAQAYLRRGALRVDAGDNNAAIADEDAALAIDSHLAAAHSVRAFALANKGDASADAAADRALALDSKQGLAWRAKMLIALRTQHYADVITQAQEALKLDAKDDRALFARGTAQLMLGQPAKALADFDETLSLATALPVHGPRAQALAGLGRGDEAMVEADRAVAADPKGSEARLIRADVRQRFGHTDLARQDMDVLIAQQPTAQNYVNRALLWQPADKAKRQADIAAALERDPRNFAATAMRAGDEIDAGDYAHAQADIDAAEALKPGSSALIHMRIDMATKRGQPQEALRISDAAVAKNAGDPAAWNERCWLKATTNTQLDTALADCDAALKLAPGSPAILDSRAFVKLRLGRNDDAIADYDAALRIVPTLAASLYGRGVAKSRRGGRADGQADLDAARHISPDIESRFTGYGVAAP